MHPDPLRMAWLLRQTDAIVADAQAARAVLHTQADFDPLCSSVGHGVVYGFLCDAKKVRLDLAPGPNKG
jgi:hypothetical protein